MSFSAFLEENEMLLSDVPESSDLDKGTFRVCLRSSTVCVAQFLSTLKLILASRLMKRTVIIKMLTSKVRWTCRCCVCRETFLVTLWLFLYGRGPNTFGSALFQCYANELI